MKRFTSASWILAFALLSTAQVFGQLKHLSYEQIFKGTPSGVLTPLPNLEGWTDEDHYLIYLKDPNDQDRLKLMRVEAATNRMEVYERPKESAVQAPPAANENNLTPSPDGKWVAFTRDNNLFTRELATGKETQISSDGSSQVYNGYAAWLYYEEILGRSSHYKAFWWSPDSKYLAFMHFDESEVPVFPIYNSEGQHGSLEKQHYPKAGDKNPKVRIGFTPPGQAATVWADFSADLDQYFGAPAWSPSSDALLVQWMPRSQDNLKIYAVRPADGSKKEIYDEKQKTWVDLDLEDRIHFLSSGKGFILKSDKTGWMHLYLHRMDGSLVNPVTQGEFTVTQLVQVDEARSKVLFMARKENSARTDLYETGLDGKGLRRLTFGDYSHEVNMSPHGKYFITTYSNVSTPPKMALLDRQGKVLRTLADAKGPAFDQTELSRTELIRVPSRDGKFQLPMTIIYPHHFDPAKKYPVLISIYGGPNAGTVYDRWSRGFLNAQWWASEGLIQVSMDNRSSGHFGKAGMDYIYRQLGKYEIEDYMDCGRYLRSLPFVDTSKVAITGGSFGGYITCMALTYGADVFTHGLANFSVTDWSLYDTHYTERYMDLPSENPEGYRITSPQQYVNRYRGLLRIVHGNIDDNVHMQNSIQLINKLEDLNKHFEFMIYPGGRHGWGGPKAIHLRSETALFIYSHLLERPMPDAFWK